MEQVVVRGVSVEKSQAKVTISGVPDKPGIAAKLFNAIADAGINVDMIVQNVSNTAAGGGKGQTDITFTINKDDISKVKKITSSMAELSSALGVDIHDGIAKLSVVGIGMRSHSGVAAKLFSALSEQGINIQMISTSEIKIAVVIDEIQAVEAAKAVHAKFELGAN
jgi:aspartate kinase